MHGKVAATGRVASIVTIVLPTGRSFDDFGDDSPHPRPTPPARPFVAGRENRLVDWEPGGESLSRFPAFP